MKRDRWLIMSAALNGVLLGLLVIFGELGGDAVPTVTPDPVSLVVSPPLMRNADAFAISGRRYESGDRAAGQRWIDLLQAAGAPDEVLAGFALADFNSRWERRALELERGVQCGEIDGSEWPRFNSQRESERRRELRIALGEEGFRTWDRARVVAELNVGGIELSAPEQDALYQSREILSQRRSELEERWHKGQIDEAEFGEQTETAQKEYDERVKALLGDERLASMQGRNDVGSGMYAALRDIGADSLQSQAITKAQRQWNERRRELDEQLQSGRLQEADYADQVRVIDAVRAEEYQRTLGADGYGKFLRFQDNRYRTMKRFASAWRLSDSDIDYLYQSIQHYEQGLEMFQDQLDAMEQQGRPADRQEAQRIIRQFSEEMSQAFRIYLGNDRFDRLRRGAIFDLDN